MCEVCEAPCERRFCGSSCAGKYGKAQQIKAMKKIEYPIGNCLQCKIEITLDKTGWQDNQPVYRKFCSRSCAARYNNMLSPKRKQEGTCNRCSEVCPAASFFCNSCLNKIEDMNISRSSSLKRTNRLKNQIRIEQWLTRKWRGGTDYGLSTIVRRYLIDQAHHACVRCRWSIPHPDTGEVPLEINHIDGNGLNHSPDNVEVLCANCHSLTSSYRGRNAGNGRPWSYHRKIKED